MDGAAGVVDEVQEHVLRRGDGVVVRPVHKGLAEARRLPVVVGAVVVPLLHQLSAVALPHMEELPCQAPCAGAVQPDAAVLPIAETDGKVGVFVCHVGSAGVGRAAVDADDLPMIPIVEVQAVDVVVDRVKDLYLYPALPQGLDLSGGKAHHAAEVIEDNLDLHAFRRLPAEDLRHAVPYLSLRNDEELQKDEMLRLLQLLQHILQEHLAGGQIRCLRITVKEISLTAQINTEPLPLGEFSPQLLHLDAVGGLLGFRLLRHGQLFQVQPLLLPVTVPEKV